MLGQAEALEWKHKTVSSENSLSHLGDGNTVAAKS